MIVKLLAKVSPTLKSRLRGWYYRRKGEWVRRHRAYSAADLSAKLRAMGIRPGDTLLVHSAYGPLLGFEGTPGNLIEAFLEAVGPTGNLLMVSLPYTSATSDYLRRTEVFDVRKTPSRMGLVSESFRRLKGVRRSLHPTHPLLAYGPKSDWIVSGHEECRFPCGEGTPYEKLFELKGKVLFFGVTEYSFTFHHYLEDRVKNRIPFALYETEPYPIKVVDEAGNERQMRAYAFTKEAISRRRVRVLFDELDRRKRIARARIGNTDLTLLEAADSVACTDELADRGIFFYDMPEKSDSRWYRKLKDRLDEAKLRRSILPAGKAELKRDYRGLPEADPGIEKAIAGALGWLCRAQDFSASGDGGVARDYSVLKGWASSYPETTGYIIPTFLEYAKRNKLPEFRARAKRMLDWLKSVQLPGGGFQGGKIDSKPVVPVIFNTGQILLGLAAGQMEFGEYGDALRKAGNWLVETQDRDGCWRTYISPFSGPGEKTYFTHVAWGLFEAERALPGNGYGRAGLANVDWTLTQIGKDDWIDKCCLTGGPSSLTHTIGYALRGVVEAYRFSGDPRYLRAARGISDRLAAAIRADGFLPGTFLPGWVPHGEWACLTGISQIAACWLLLFRETGEAKYRDAALAANRYVRRTVSFDVPPEMAGAVKGSFPLDGGYCRFEYPNWASKFLVDALLLESALDAGMDAGASRPSRA